MSDLNERAARLMGFQQFRPGHWHAPDTSIYGTGNVTFGTHWHPDTDPTQCEQVVAAAVAARGKEAFRSALIDLLEFDSECDAQFMAATLDWLATAPCESRLRAAVKCLETLNAATRQET